MKGGAILVVVAVGCAGQPKPAPRYTALEKQQIREHERAGTEAFDRGSLRYAAAHFDWLITRYPELVGDRILESRAAVYFLTKDYEAGLAFVDDVAVRLAKDRRGVHEQRALILWGMKRVEEAIESAERAIAHGRDDAYQAQLLLGTYYFGRDARRSAAAFAAYLRFRPRALQDRDGMPLLKLGLAYLVIDEPHKAREQFERAREQFRGRKSIVQNAENGLCAVYALTEEYDLAIELCGTIVAEPRRVDRKGSAYFNLARAYLGNEQPGEALPPAHKYVEINPVSDKGWLLLADANLALGNCEDATRAFDKAVDRGTSDAETSRLTHELRQCSADRTGNDGGVPPPQPSSTGEGAER